MSLATKTGVVAEMTEVTKIYEMGVETVHALAGVSHSFEKGSFWAIMGQSGSGKSTLLNLIGCLDRPTSGSYSVAGEEVAQLDDHDLSEIRLRYLGFIFQSFNLIPQLTVAENIALPLFYMQWEAGPSHERAKELAELVGLGERLNHRPSELSGGQQQRVAIARSLANDPMLILADEPTGNLDSTTTNQIMELLVNLNKQGKTIILVTHEPEIASHVPHHLHMRDGKIDRIEGADS